MARVLGVSANGTALIAESFASVLQFYISFRGSGVEDEGIGRYVRNKPGWG